MKKKIEPLNKTIVISYDDATRMVDFCLDSERSVSREFYDWYLKDKAEYFTKSADIEREATPAEAYKITMGE